MKKTFKKLIALTSAVSLTALSVAGCGGSSQTSADAGKGSEQSQAAAETKLMQLLHRIRQMVRITHRGIRLQLKLPM